MTELASLPWYVWPVGAALLLGGWWLHRRAETSLDASAAALGVSVPAAGRGGSAAAGAESDLVAVMAAAVAVVTGLEASQFRIAGISPAGPAARGGAAGSGSWNTPLWGRVERFARPDTLR